MHKQAKSSSSVQGKAGGSCTPALTESEKQWLLYSPKSLKCLAAERSRHQHGDPSPIRLPLVAPPPCLTLVMPAAACPTLENPRKTFDFRS